MVEGLLPKGSNIATPSPRQHYSKAGVASRTPVQQKHGSITYAEYREYSSAIHKLCDTIKLFLEVNKDLIEGESSKKAAKKGQWRSTKALRRATDLMERTLTFFKTVQIKPVNNRPGVFSDIYTHFVEEDEQVRMERDIKTAQSHSNEVHRMLSYRFMPQIVDSPENKALISEFKIISEEYIEVAEEAMNPLSMACCPRRRFNCHCCFRSIFGETKQMGKVLEKTFEGEHRWIKPD